MLHSAEVVGSPRLRRLPSVHSIIAAKKPWRVTDGSQVYVRKFKILDPSSSNPSRPWGPFHHPPRPWGPYPDHLEAALKVLWGLVFLEWALVEVLMF